MDYDKLLTEVKKFIMDSKRGQNYTSAMKLKWRTMVIKYIKDLRSIDFTDDYYNYGTDILYMLFNLLEEARVNKIFMTNNPFKDINIDEVELYEHIIKRYFIKMSDTMLEKLLLNTIELCTLNSRYLIWPIYILVRESIKNKVVTTLLNMAKDNYKKYYKEYRKNNTNQLFLEYLMLNIFVIGVLGDNIKKTVDYYYSYFFLDRNEEFEMICDIALALENNQILMYVYEDGLSRRLKPSDEIKKEYDNIKVKS